MNSKLRPISKRNLKVNTFLRCPHPPHPFVVLSMQDNIWHTQKNVFAELITKHWAAGCIKCQANFTVSAFDKMSDKCYVHKINGFSNLWKASRLYRAYRCCLEKLASCLLFHFIYKIKTTLKNSKVSDQKCNTKNLIPNFWLQDQYMDTTWWRKFLLTYHLY